MRSRVFYGWWVVLVAGIGTFLGPAPIVYYTFGVFINPLSQEFQWSRSELSFAYSTAVLGLTVGTLLIGRLVDHLGARRVIVSSTLIFGLGLISFYSLSPNLWHLYAIYLVLGSASAGNSLVPYFRVISQWFDKKRGLAMGLTMLGIGLGAFVMPSLANTLITELGWRNTYVIFGGVVLAVSIPVIVLFFKETPQQMGLLPDGERMARAETPKQGSQYQGMTGREAWHTGTFWILAMAFFLVSASGLGCVVHLVPILTDRGFSTQSAAFATSLFGWALLLGRVGTGYLLDRIFGPYVAFCFFSAAALGIFLLWSGVEGGLAFIAAFLVGLGVGSEGDVMPYMLGRYFGLRAFGEIYGYALASFNLGVLVGPLLMGVGFDSTGSYRLVLGVFLLATLTSAGLMLRLGPYRKWESARESAQATLVSSSQESP